ENAMGDGPRATPTLHDGIVYMYTGDGILCAADQKSGEIVWQVDTMELFNAEPSDYGMSSSPLVVQGQVVVHVGAADATIAAFDSKSGKPTWKAGRGPAGYSSPTLLHIDKKEQVVSITGDEAVGIDPSMGETLWSYPFKTDYACNTATPIAVNGDVFISSGENHGCVMLDIKPNNGAYEATERWASLNSKSVMRNEWQTSVVKEGFLYGFDNVGAAGPVTHLSCIDVETGKPVWQQKRFGKGNLVLADGKLWITTIEGELVLVKATPEKFEELGRAKLFGKTRQSLSIANGRGYIRDDDEVVCFKLK
ncbi:MAG: PQQ-binding-like beta-propeller repeat protein, partial [Planctomycetota bacterium]|nr:PQQ-binding-like beta-propeller repeat protein [Planctomycetota bacterium]